MPIEIRYATEADAPALANINIVSFQDQPFWQNAFPGCDPAEGLPQKTARVFEKISTPNVHVLVAVDTEFLGKDGQDAVVGYARWVFPSSAEPNVQPLSEAATDMIRRGKSGELVPTSADRAVLERHLHRMKEKQAEHVRADDMALELLATLPAYQGRGVGSTMLRWGVAKADELNVRIYLEATAAGYPIYVKYGWRDIEDLVMDYGQVFKLMRRMPSY